MRTIIEKANGVDRATLARLQRIKPDKLAEAYKRGRIRTRDALPRKIDEAQKNIRRLIKETKGLA